MLSNNGNVENDNYDSWLNLDLNSQSTENKENEPENVEFKIANNIPTDNQMDELTEDASNT